MAKAVVVAKNEGVVVHVEDVINVLDRLGLEVKRFVDDGGLREEGGCGA